MDSQGRLYFVDPVKQNIYRYLPIERRLEVVRDNPIDPANLFFDRSDNLMVVSYAGNGTVYSLKPDDPADRIEILKPQPAALRPGLTPVLADRSLALRQRAEYQYRRSEAVAIYLTGWEHVSSGRRGLRRWRALLRYQDGGHTSCFLSRQSDARQTVLRQR